MSNGALSFIDQFIQQGVTDFCIAPGSRSTPLALAVARHPKATLTVHFDERGLGFYALGVSIASQKPTVVIVTSGTAVGNLLPAVMEAHHSRVPLILLTADRPAELRDCSANQATDQIKIFANFVLWQTDLPCSGEEDFFRAQASYALFQALQGGPVHLNCPFREPLYTKPSFIREGTSQIQSFPKFSTNYTLPKVNRGLILIGKLPFQTDLSPLFQLAHQLCWPIFADLLSSARPHPQLINSFDWMIEAKEFEPPELILHFGGRFTSKILLEWIKREKIKILHISSDPTRIEPLHADRVWADPGEFCKSLSYTSSKDGRWLKMWQQLDQKIREETEEVFSTPHPFTEPDLMRMIGEQLPEGWAVFMGNSMPIRDGDHFLFPKQRTHFFANRGLSGIDGQIATAVGIASKLKKPLCAILGDLSSLHDLNSLPLLHTLTTPFLLVISNNFGGGIFSHLPVSEEQEHFERLWGAGHSFSFEGVAQMFGIPYRKEGPLFPCTSPSIIEISTSRQQNTQFRNEVLKRARPCSTIS